MIIFDSTAAIVKPADRPFGHGIIRSRPTYHAPYTASDAAWWASESARLENERLDAMAEESAAMDRLERGLIFA